MHTRLPSSSRREGESSQPSSFKYSEGRAAGTGDEDLSPDQPAGSMGVSRGRRATGDGEELRASRNRRFIEDGQDEGARYPSRRVTDGGDGGEGLRASRRLTGYGQGEDDHIASQNGRPSEGFDGEGRRRWIMDGKVGRSSRSRRDAGDGDGLAHRDSRSRRETGDGVALVGRSSRSRRQTGEGLDEVGSSGCSRRETGEGEVDREGRGQEGRTLKRVSTSTRKRDAAMPHAYAPGGDIEKPRRSPAVVAALSGRTMLRQVSIPGRHFRRSIPSMNSNRSSLLGVLEEDAQASEHD
ncbi:hypothetical protein DUNSADRAFT_16915 [Dunaliella salina]|nr:hypothetical protein DUNSADRAFT_16915 [Dunaliella salina]|eukprot:KAF5843416.1 hypothetical protein DUNSADRAFT_16915 [Dunaliella salina]